jgi:hypothetical protein
MSPVELHRSLGRPTPRLLRLEPPVCCEIIAVLCITSGVVVGEQAAVEGGEDLYLAAVHVEDADGLVFANSGDATPFNKPILSLCLQAAACYKATICLR